MEGYELQLKDEKTRNFSAMTWTTPLVLAWNVFIHHKPCNAPNENFFLPRGTPGAGKFGKQQTCRRKIVRESRR